MKFVCPLVFLLCLGAVAAKDSTHPITKVIALLEGLQQKSIAEGKGEAVSYQKFTHWCQNSISALSDAITGEKEAIAELEDLLSGKKKEKEVLEKQIETLNGQLAEMDASDMKAKKIRKDEVATYTQVLADVKGTIKAVDDALVAMTSAGKSTEPGMLLAQSHVRKVVSLISVSSSVTETELSTLQVFARPDQLAKGDLNKHVDKYDFKSENVIELLKGLKAKFEDEELQATKEETAAQNAFDLATAARDGAIAAAEKSKKKKGDTLAEVDKTIAQTIDELKNQNDDLKADSKGKADTQSECQEKKDQWEARSGVRSNEIAAMETAMKILSKASGIRTAPPGNPIPPASPVNFLQIVSESDKPKMAAVEVLREAAKETHSRALERLAVEVAAHLTGPFQQVNNMIEKMIFRLMDEQKQEDEHKHWCDQEIKKTNVMLDDKDDKIKDLAAEIKEETAAIGTLTEEIEAADQMIADIIGFKKEATEIRTTGKTENKLAIKDAALGQTSLAEAIAVLTSFYKESGEMPKESWELIQEPVKLPKNPNTWDSPYTGVSSPENQPNGIVTVLETVMSDFAKMEADTKANEVQDQEEYDTNMSDNDIEMARRKQESAMKEGEKKRRVENRASLTSQEKDTKNEWEKTDEYMPNLKPACGTGSGADSDDYDNRKAARTKEVTALKKAQDILETAFDEQKGGNPSPRAARRKFLQIRRHA